MATLSDYPEVSRRHFKSLSLPYGVTKSPGDDTPEGKCIKLILAEFGVFLRKCFWILPATERQSSSLNSFFKGQEDKKLAIS